MKWFRLYHDLVDDPKAQRMPPALFKHWINFLCLASMSEPRGLLPPPDDIAFRLRMSDDEVSDALAELTARGLLESNGDGYAPHNWLERQRSSDDGASRVANWRAKQRGSDTPAEQKQDAFNGVTLHVSSHDTPGNCSRATESDSDSESEETQRERGASPPPDPPADADAPSAPPAPKKQRVQKHPYPDETEAIAYFTANGGSEEKASRFYCYYAGIGWKQGKGKAPIVDWQLIARNWIAEERKEREQLAVRRAGNGARASPAESFEERSQRNAARIAEIDARRARSEK